VGTANIAVTDTVGAPTVSIGGIQVVSMFRWQRVDLFAVASLPSCAVNSSSSLVYSWKVYDGFDYVPSLSQTESLDQRFFKLAAYKFNINTQYSVQVKVTAALLNSVPATGGAAAFSEPGASVSSTALVTVNVGQSGVVAVIKGGASRTVSVTATLVVDGSGSYDIDYPSDAQTLLTFEWACMITSPTYGTSCGGTTSDLTNQILFRDPSGLVPGSTYRYQLTVRNINTQQVSTAATLITILSLPLPILSIESAAEQGKFNPESKIILTATVQTAAGASATTVYWGSVDEFQLDLTPLASSSTSSIIPSTLATTVSEVQLALRPYSLLEGNEYVFAVSAFYNNNPGSVASSSVTIVMNSPPANGLIAVTPTEGGAYSTEFLLQTSSWVDDASDLPLSYVFFSYTTSNSTFSTVRSRSPMTHVKGALLRQGPSSLDFAVNCAVLAEDIFGGSAVAITTVTVNPLLNPIPTVSSNIGSLLTSAFSRTDAARVSQLVASASAALNAVDCSNMPANAVNCEALHRYGCELTANTCGVCKPGFVGVSGDANVLCYAVSAIGRRRLGDSSIKRVGEECVSNSECLSGTCALASPLSSSTVCVDSPKGCQNNCTQSNLGVCVFYGRNGEELESCGSGDAYCSARCRCTTGHFGSDCSLSSADYTSVLQSRQVLSAGILTTAYINDLSQDFILSSANNIIAGTADPVQLNYYAVGNCTATLKRFISNQPSIAGSDAVYSTIYTALSNIWATITMPVGILSEEAAQDALEHRAASQAQVTELMTLLSLARQSSLAVGETGSSIMSPSFRLYTEKKLGSALAAVTLPQSDYEAFNEVLPGEVALNNTENAGSSSAVGTTLIQYLTNSQNISHADGDTVTTQNSSGIMVELKYYVNQATLEGIKDVAESYSTLVVLRNTDPIHYEYIAPEAHEVYCPFSDDHEPFRGSVQCPMSLGANASGTAVGHYSFEYTCPGGVRGMYKITCPSMFEAPQCTTWDFEMSSFQPNPLCRVVEFTPYNTTCECRVSVGASANRRRKLTTVNGDSSSWDQEKNVLSIEYSSSLALHTDSGQMPFDPFSDPLVEYDFIVGLFSSALILLATLLAIAFGYMDLAEHQLIYNYTEEIVLGIGPPRPIDPPDPKLVADVGETIDANSEHNAKVKREENGTITTAATAPTPMVPMVTRKYSRTVESFFTAILPAVFDKDGVIEFLDPRINPDTDTFQFSSSWLDKYLHYLGTHNEYFGPFVHSISSKGQTAIDDNIIEDVYLRSQGRGETMDIALKLRREFPHCMQWGKVIFRVLNVLAVSTLVVSYLFPDDGLICEVIIEENECLIKETQFNKIVASAEHETSSFCEWDYENLFCTVRPSFDEEYSQKAQMFMVVRLLTVVLLACVPLNVLANYLFSRALNFIPYWQLFKTDVLGRKRTKANSVAIQPTAVEASTYNIGEDLSTNVDGTVRLGSDEMKESETKMSVWMKAARLAIMRRDIDFALPVDEVDHLLHRGFNGEYRFFSANRYLIRINKLYGSNKIAWWLIVFPVWCLDWLDGFFMRFVLHYFANSNDDVMTFTSSLRALGKVMQHGLLGAHQIKTTLPDGTAVGTVWKSRMLDKYVQDVRLLTGRIRNKMKKMADPVQRENFLIKSLIMSSLSSEFKRNLCERYFIAAALADNENRVEGARNDKGLEKSASANFANIRAIPYETEFYSMVVFICYILAALFVIFYMGTVEIGSKSANLWLLVVGFALAEDMFYVLPVHIYLLWIGIPRLIRDEVNQIRDVFYKKFKMVMKRRTGSVRSNSVHSLLHHLHPICRVARGFPELPVSRFIFSLNDFDLLAPAPFVSYYNRTFNSIKAPFVHFFYELLPTVLFLQWWVLMPIAVQDRVLEFVVIAACNAVLYGVMKCWVVSASSTLILIIVAVLLFLNSTIFEIWEQFTGAVDSLINFRDNVELEPQVRTLYKVQEEGYAETKTFESSAAAAERMRVNSQKVRANTLIDEFTGRKLYTNDGLIMRYVVPNVADVINRNVEREIEMQAEKARVKTKRREKPVPPTLSGHEDNQHTILRHLGDLSNELDERVVLEMRTKPAPITTNSSPQASKSHRLYNVNAVAVGGDTRTGSSAQAVVQTPLEPLEKPVSKTLPRPGSAALPQKPVRPKSAMALAAARAVDAVTAPVEVQQLTAERTPPAVVTPGGQIQLEGPPLSISPSKPPSYNAANVNSFNGTQQLSRLRSTRVSTTASGNAPISGPPRNKLPPINAQNLDLPHTNSHNMSSSALHQPLSAVGSSSHIGMPSAHIPMAPQNSFLQYPMNGQMSPYAMNNSHYSLVQPAMTMQQQPAMLQQQAMLQQHAMMQQQAMLQQAHASMYGQNMLGSPSMLMGGSQPSMIGVPYSPMPMPIASVGSAVHLSPDGRPRGQQQQGSRPSSSHRKSSRPSSSNPTRPSSGNLHRDVARDRRIHSASQRRPQQGGQRAARPMSSSGVRMTSPAQFIQQQEQRQRSPPPEEGFDENPAVRMVSNNPYTTPQHHQQHVSGTHAESMDSLPVEHAEEEW